MGRPAENEVVEGGGGGERWCVNAQRHQGKGRSFQVVARHVSLEVVGVSHLKLISIDRTAPKLRLEHTFSILLE